MRDRFQGGRLGDYVIDCDICGQRCWYSESSVLGIYTGRGGLLVCPECKDPIDYGIVPYYVIPERPITNTREANRTASLKSIPQKYKPFLADNMDPAAYSPEQANSYQISWDLLSQVTWDNWGVPLSGEPVFVTWNYQVEHTWNNYELQWGKNTPGDVAINE